MTERSTGGSSSVRAKRTLRELTLFLTVGFLNTAFAYAVYALALYLTLPYPLAIALSMAASIAVGFFAQGRMVFENSDPKRLLRYVVMWFLLLIVHTLIVNRTIAFGGSAYLGGLVAIIPVVLLSYLIQKYFVFAQKH
jgi:putative flippase GtrA